MSLVNVGSSAHYSISWDDDPNPVGAPALTQADGPDRARQLLAICEQDYNLMASWFPGLSLPHATPIAVNIVPGGYAGAGPGHGARSAHPRWIGALNTRNTSAGRPEAQPSGAGPT
jgi:hypothetical protein